MIAAMPWKQRIGGWRALVLCGVLASIALIGGADRISASTVTACNQPDPTGREYCITIEDLDGVSPSGTVGSGARQVNVTAYQYYKFSVANNGGSTLTNGIVTIVLTDRFFEGDPANSKALFIASGSDSFCSLTKTTPNTVTCRLPNIAANSPLNFTVGYRTSDAANVKETVAAVTATFKEGTKNGANPSTLVFDPPVVTSLEPDPERSVAWSPPGQAVSMATSSADDQFSVLDYKVPAGKLAFVASLAESNGYVCAPGETCFGELVTTDLTQSGTTFSAANRFHIQIAVSLDIAPGGSLSDYVVSHQLQDGSFEILRQPEDECSANPPPVSEPLPCFKVTKDNRLKLLIFDIYAFQNGGWMPG